MIRTTIPGLDVNRLQVAANIELQRLRKSPPDVGMQRRGLFLAIADLAGRILHSLRSIVRLS